MKQIKILCSRPGFRRAGMEHPKEQIYPADYFTNFQLEVLKNEPVLTVIEVSDQDEKLLLPEPEDLPDDENEQAQNDPDPEPALNPETDTKSDEVEIIQVPENIPDVTDEKNQPKPKADKAGKK